MPIPVVQSHASGPARGPPSGRAQVLVPGGLCEAVEGPGSSSPKPHEDAVTAPKAPGPDLPREYPAPGGPGREAHEGATRPRRAPRAAQRHPRGHGTPAGRPLGPQDEVAGRHGGHCHWEQTGTSMRPPPGVPQDEPRLGMATSTPGPQRMNLGTDDEEEEVRRQGSHTAKGPPPGVRPSWGAPSRLGPRSLWWGA